MKIFEIGDHVVVTGSHDTLFVPTGSEGVIIGGDKGKHVVTFTVRKNKHDIELELPIMLTQEDVPSTCMEFVSIGSAFAPTVSLLSSNTNESSSEEEEEEGEEEEDILELLRRTLTPKTYETCIQTFSLEELEEYRTKPMELNE